MEMSSNTLTDTVALKIALGILMLKCNLSLKSNKLQCKNKYKHDLSSFGC